MNSKISVPINLSFLRDGNIKRLVDLVEEISVVRLERRYDLGSPNARVAGAGSH